MRRYVHGPGDNEPLVVFDYASSGAKSWLHADSLSSVIGVTNAAGANTVTNTYSEYGLPGPGNSGRFQYTGQTWLPEIGMYYCITTRPVSTTRPSAASCRPTPSDTQMA